MLIHMSLWSTHIAIPTMHTISMNTMERYPQVRHIATYISMSRCDTVTHIFQISIIVIGTKFGAQIAPLGAYNL